MRGNAAAFIEDLDRGSGDPRFDFFVHELTVKSLLPESAERCSKERL